METLPKFVDMALTPVERTELGMDSPASVTSPAQPTYPYGLSICFTQEELEKLDLEEATVGDHLVLHCLVKVTSVSKNDTTEGVRSRTEMQIVGIEAEGEDGDEDEDEEPLPASSMASMAAKAYKK